LFGKNIQRTEPGKVQKGIAALLRGGRVCSRRTMLLGLGSNVFLEFVPPLHGWSACSRRAGSHRFVAKVYLLNVVGFFLLALAPVNLSHAETLDSKRPPEYFHSNLSASTSLIKEPVVFCEEGCLPEKYFLAEKSQRKSSVRKIPHSSRHHPGLELNTDYFLGILSDTKYIFLSPLRWNTSDWLKASLVLGATGAFFALDDKIQNYVQDKRNGTTDDLANVFEPFGNGGYAFPGLVAFYIVGHFTENEKVKRTALLAVESFAVTGIFNFALKFSTGRTRPQSARNSRQWNGFSTSDDSFASGHTSSVFAVATVLASEYKNNPWVPPVAYGLATLTGLSRLNDNKHWASDVFFGGALGYFVAKTVLKLHSNKKGRHYTIYPRISKKETGLVFAMRF